MGRKLLWIVGILAVLGGVVAVGLRIPAVQDVIVRRVIAQRLNNPPRELLRDDALSVVLCGTSSPMPHPTRARPCVAVFAGGRFWVIDTGSGSWNNLAMWQIDGANIAGVLLTHFHSDHMGELGEFNLQTWVAGRSGPLQVFGPPGVERVVNGFNEAYTLDRGYRVAHHGAEVLAPEVGPMEARVVTGPADGAGPTVALKDGDLTITAFSVTHEPISPAYGYRFDYRGRSVVVSGDTVKDAGLIAAAKGADVLLHEAQANHIVDVMREEVGKTGRTRLAKILGDIPSYHTTPVQAAEVANEAGVDLLVMYHLTPPPPAALLEDVFLRGVDDVRPDGWVLADDGLVVTLPVGSDVVDVWSLE